MAKKVPCEVFCRIVGYYRPVQNWNSGKVEEYHDRKFFVAESKAEGCGCGVQSIKVTA
jgi:hypothetical protein